MRRIYRLVGIGLIGLIVVTRLEDPASPQGVEKLSSPAPQMSQGDQREPGIWREPLDAQGSMTVQPSVEASPEVGAAVESVPEAVVPEAVQVFMQDRDYLGAIRAIDEALAEGRGPADYLIYLKGQAFHNQKDYDSAVEVFRELVSKYPRSPWVRRAKFAEGVALARKGSYRAAERIYREQAEFLLSTERKQEIASIYLDFADAYFEPEDRTKQPDYEQARKFYTKALEVGPEPGRRAAVELRVGQCFERIENWPEAEKQYAEFVKKSKDSKDLKDLNSDDQRVVWKTQMTNLRIDAAYRLGWCQLKQGKHAAARRTWQDLWAEDHRDDSTLSEASRERLAEASFHLAETYGAPAPPSTEDLDLAVAALDAFIESHSNHALASTAHLRAIECLMHGGRFDTAATRIAGYLANTAYANRDETPQIRFLLGTCFARQKAFDAAIQAWRDYLAKHPAHAGWSQAQQAIVDTEFMAAAEARRKKDDTTARKLWTEFLARYPLDPRAARILLEFGQMHYDQKQWDDALADWRRVVSKYPNTNESSQAQFQIAQLLETEQGRLEEALKEYKKLTWGSHAEAAKQRIAQLLRQEMTIATERVFRTDETPTLALSTRNIEEVEVKVYTVDLETYFRKMHLARGVEGLDIALIDPDATYTYKVPEYAKLKSIASRIEVPLPAKSEANSPASSEKPGASTEKTSSTNAHDAGVLAVTVSSKTLEATTLVIRSDLDIIVKSSRDEVFVFAENMRTGTAWPGVRLLISDGNQVFTEAMTGAEGIFQQGFPNGKELQSANDLRVFAIADGSVASNIIGLQGLGVSQGLSDKGYIYTDRPAYRAGQMVHVRGVIRRVSGDQYVVDEKKAFDLCVLDPRGRQIWSGEVALNAYGSFHCHFLIPDASPQGAYRIDVREKVEEGGKRSYQGTFAVHAYQLEPIRLAIDTPRRVYYRGETIDGTIRAVFYYGAPLAGRTIRYQLADEPVVTATTDAQGEVKFSLPTREYRETQPLPLVVELPERNLATQTVFILATRGFSIATQTARDLFLAGESFETTITTTDAEGKPVGRNLEVILYQVTEVSGEKGEQKIAARQLTTSEKDGVGRVTFAAKEGGQYFVRITGQDQFGHPITAQHTVSISDDKDEVRLRILAERHTFKVGDTAAIRVHWREKPALALVTYQGATVLGYRLVELEQGENRLDLPMTAALAPNFDLAIAVMTDPKPGTAANDTTATPPRRFHEASSPFTVVREMRVDVAIQGDGTAQPGDEVEVAITTTDPQGRPLAAELSLAMIERSLLDRFGSNVATINDFFRGSSRESAVRTTSSITFDYQPKTRSINANLLAEQERREIEESEEVALESLADEVAVVASGAPHDHRLLVAVPTLETDTDLPAEAIPPPPRAPASKLPERQRSSSESGLLGGTGGFRGEDMNADGAQTQRAGEDFSRILSGDEAQELHIQQLGETRDAWVRNIHHFDMGSQFRYAIPQNKDAASEVLNQFKLEERFKDNSVIAFYNSNGEWSYTNLAAKDGEQLDMLAGMLAESGAVLIPAEHSPETGYWNPSIVTDADGKAVVTLTIPNRATEWQVQARGITAAETLAGEGEAKLVAKKDLFGELKLPLAFVDGDTAQIAVTVHHGQIESGTISVTLKTTIGSWTTTETRTVPVEKKGLSEVTFEAKIDRKAGMGTSEAGEDSTGDGGVGTGENARAGAGLGAGPKVEAQFELTVEAGGVRDVARSAVPIQAYGMTVIQTAGGSAVSDTTAWIELPADMPVADPAMQIVIGPNIARSLMDIVLAPAPWCQVEAARFGPTIDGTSSDLLAALALVQLLAATQQSDGPEAASLDVRIRAGIGSLVAAQRDDGGWNWCGLSSDQIPGNRYMTARIVWALQLARKAGYPVPDEAFDKAIGYLEGELAKLDNADNESRAVVVHALTVADRGDFAQVNRLYRDRQNLSPTGLCYVAMAFAALDRMEPARELLALISQQDLDAMPTSKRPGAALLAWNQSGTELRALYALALQETMPNDPGAKAQADWLLAHRTGHRWSPDKATGPATMALTRVAAKQGLESDAYRLTVFVNNRQAAELEITPSACTQTLDVPAELLVFAGGMTKQTVRFQLTGRGQYTYQIALGGFVPADQLKKTTTDWEVQRYYQPAPLELDGEPVPRGFDVVDGEYVSFRNPMTQLPVGVRGEVELHVWRTRLGSRPPADSLAYLTITEPIPSGATVVEDSIQGGFERYEIGPGAITFYLGGRQHIGTIRYDLHGYLPGTYHVAPTVVRDAYDPGRLAIAPAMPMTVLPLGTTGQDPYKPTPDELFHLGKRHFTKGRWKEAAENLAKLLADWRLDAEPYQESVRMLLDAHLEIGPPNEVVKYFEVIKEKWPEMEIPFDKILKIGDAYHTMGEYERSYMVFRATVESSFLREVRVAGFLDSEGEFLKGIAVMGRLLQEYPPEPYVAAARYALAQQVYAKADELAADAALRAKLREQKITRIDLVRQSLGMLGGFLTSYAEDPAADEAAFSLANALLELKQYQPAIAACRKYVSRFPDSHYVESYWYTIGYCHFALGDHADALETCRKVSEMQRKDKKTGRMVAAENRWEAIYILGQIYHSLGQAAEAIREYTRVQDRFPDAAQAIEYFTRQEIRLPEVTTLVPGEEKPIDLEFRNIATCDVWVYKIDLMKFSLLRRNLKDITKINLAGIRPFHEATITLGDGKDYRDRTQAIPLPLHQEGAYLVVCRGGDLHASGLVLVSPLVVDVQEDPASGRVRVTVKDRSGEKEEGGQGKYQANVHVKVIGSENDEFLSGETDLRGVFVADAIAGTSTVIAQANSGQYAFFRGTTRLGPVAEKAGVEEQVEGRQEGAAPSTSTPEDLLQNVYGGRKAVSGANTIKLQQLYQNPAKGVQVQQAK